VTPAALRRELRAHAEPGYATTLAGFFKTGPGEYGEGDKFLGVRVPQIRRIAGIGAREDDRAVIPLLRSEWHEERLLALLILVRRFQHGSSAEKKDIFDLYLRETAWINNWDLVDTSAHHIVGAWLLRRPRGILRRLARSESLWERRIAVVATWTFIRAGDPSTTFALCKCLLRDPHDLIHKACGWMLREAGKHDRPALENFLTRHAAAMPRTMLRYAIEHFPGIRRKFYLRMTPCEAPY